MSNYFTDRVRAYQDRQNRAAEPPEPNIVPHVLDSDYGLRVQEAFLILGYALDQLGGALIVTPQELAEFRDRKPNVTFMRRLAPEALIISLEAEDPDADDR